MLRILKFVFTKFAKTANMIRTEEPETQKTDYEKNKTNSNKNVRVNGSRSG